VSKLGLGSGDHCARAECLFGERDHERITKGSRADHERITRHSASHIAEGLVNVLLGAGGVKARIRWLGSGLGFGDRHHGTWQAAPLTSRTKKTLSVWLASTSVNQRLKQPVRTDRAKQPSAHTFVHTSNIADAPSDRSMYAITHMACLPSSISAHLCVKDAFTAV